MKFLLWCILLVLCWPLALAALVLYPIVWLLLLPFRLVGIAVDGACLSWFGRSLPCRRGCCGRLERGRKTFQGEVEFAEHPPRPEQAAENALRG